MAVHARVLVAVVALCDEQEICQRVSGISNKTGAFEDACEADFVVAARTKTGTVSARRVTFDTARDASVTHAMVAARSTRVDASAAYRRPARHARYA